MITDSDFKKWFLTVYKKNNGKINGDIMDYELLLIEQNRSISNDRIETFGYLIKYWLLFNGCEEVYLRHELVERNMWKSYIKNNNINFSHQKFILVYKHDQKMKSIFYYIHHRGDAKYNSELTYKHTRYFCEHINVNINGQYSSSLICSTLEEYSKCIPCRPLPDMMTKPFIHFILCDSLIECCVKVIIDNKQQYKDLINILPSDLRKLIDL